jgi:hypothetical protein
MKPPPVISNIKGKMFLLGLPDKSRLELIVGLD